MGPQDAFPAPIISCVLPEYEEEHIWWLFLQYLARAGFHHTHSSFLLELKALRGAEVPEDRYKHLSEVGGLMMSLCVPKAAPECPTLSSNPPQSVVCCHCCRVVDPRTSYVHTLACCWCGS